ncbi:hypothetical protein ANO14919_091600 [Xylariales sp. No.14919]|nr:hypothetical protein ANO14919_091600 [Xylariales sp. No.14919]
MVIVTVCAPCQDFISKHLHWEVILSNPTSYHHSQARATEERSPGIFLRSADSADDRCYIRTRLFSDFSEHLQSQLRVLGGPLPRNKRHGVRFDTTPTSIRVSTF